MLELAAGVDIGGTNTKIGLVDRQGVIHSSASFSTADYITASDFILALHAEITRLVGCCGKAVALKGIGIGAPNANYYRGTIENAANLPWKGIVNIRDILSALFTSMPVVITNDANTAAIGEMIYGGAKGIDDFLVVTLGTGLGSGFVANGELIHGHDSFAGELGHIIIEDGGRKCGCGRRGCVETYVSATGIKRTVLSLMAETDLPSVFRSGKVEDISAKMIAQKAAEGDELALAAFDDAGKVLGKALAIAVSITSPKVIFLLGGLAQAGGLIFAPAKKYMEEYLLPAFRGSIDILPSQLNLNDAAILGASSLVWKSNPLK